MTISQFFKSTTFRCILVLVCIALVSGGLLAILNDLWHVSEEEKTNRAISEVCGDGVKLKETLDLAAVNTSLNDATILNAYLLDNGAILLKSEGTKGYHSGSITLYVLLEKDGTDYVIKSASVAEYASSQTLMSKFNAASLEKFAKNDDYIEAGATYSSNAVKNAISASKTFAKEELPKLLKEGN